MATARLLLRSTESKSVRFGFVQPLPPEQPSVSGIWCLNRTTFPTGDHFHLPRRMDEERKPKQPVAVVASQRVVTLEPPQADWAGEMAALVANVRDAGLTFLRVAARRRPWKSHVQMLIERTIIDCRFFTLFAAAGTLLGSLLCFIEGCFTVLESYIQYFYLMSQKGDQGHVMHLLLEALDMFLVGTAMLIFGVSLYAMFVGSKSCEDAGGQPRFTDSSLFGLYYLNKLPAWVELQSVSQAKSKIGHAVMLILQVGMLEKFKSVPIVTGLDLACFAGAVLFSSASIFLLSRLSPGRDSS